jgi:hypothetical protein
MFKQKVEPPVKIPDEALHLSTDLQITRSLRSRGHDVRNGRRFATATHKDSGATVSWTPTADCSPQPIRYRSQIIRALVRLGFFAVLVMLALHFGGLI